MKQLIPNRTRNIIGSKVSTPIRILFYLHVLLVVFFFTSCGDSSSRYEKDLSGSGWKLYLDSTALWRNDKLFLPPVDLSALPVNQPSIGWENLASASKKEVLVPGTVEGYYWSIMDSSGKKMGDYRGVSWWSRKISIPRKLKGKNVTLMFQSVNLRAEVYLNHKLVGYDLIGNTPFEVNITDAAQYGGSNELDVRVTDIGGTFSWDDEKALIWGTYSVPSVHGFGGITGKVILRATDYVHIDDIYVQNQPVPTNAKVFITVGNTSGEKVDGILNLVIHEWNNPRNILSAQSKDISIGQGSQEVMFEVSAPNAQLWQVKDPHLYASEVTFTGKQGTINDIMTQKFGFKFMTVGENNGDSRLYMNGKRIFLFAAMTRGFWPKMGMFPIPGMAERDIQEVIKLGYNMIMYHRAIGQPTSMDLCDDMGILTYEEPGGYQSLPYPPTEFAQQWRKEKLRRMILRDRSRASLTNWNMDDWSYNEPNNWDFENIKMVHTLDPSRIVTFNCIQEPADTIRKQNPLQLHMLPFDTTCYFDGWYDPYHFAAQQGYVDEYYKNPRNYARYLLDPDHLTLGDSTDVVPKDQIYFLGEEGAFGTQLNLQRIKDDLQSMGSDGWMDGDYLNWYKSYDTFLDKAGMRDAFPTVENLTMKMGHNLHYFHGRIIENTRMMNIADGYVLNGWAGASTNTDIVDTYRHPTGDPSILPYYAQPLYVAVKIRNKVVPSGVKPVADIFLINEKDINGPHKLNLALTAPDGKVIFTNSYETNILGGEEFGQLLVGKVVMPVVSSDGYYKLNATLTDPSGSIKATGSDELFVADYMIDSSIPDDAAVIDTSGIINSFLMKTRGLILTKFDPSAERPSVIVLGMHNINTIDVPKIISMVEQGTKLLIFENAQSWLSKLPVKQIPRTSTANGTRNRGLSGRQFVGISPYFEGLPQATAMSWEYQVFYRNNSNGLSILPEGLNTIVGVGPVNSGTIGISLCELTCGQGSVILSSLSIVPNLNNNRPDCAVAKKLFMNLLSIHK